MLNHSLVPVGSTGYDIDNSLRFNDDDSAYLSRTPSTAGNRKTWTWSAWVKRSELGTGVSNRNMFFEAKDSGDNWTYFGFQDDEFRMYSIFTPTDYGVRSTRLFRDTSAWYHIVVIWDTTEATASDRIKLYVNNEQVTLEDVYGLLPSNYEGHINRASIVHNIGRNTDQGQYFDGYLADVHFIDGQALTPADFGETGDYGEWKPKKYTGTYGTNGFYLDFKNSGSLGNDVSGAGNNWTPTNLAATDQMLDSPTNNFATWNAIEADVSALAEGNLKVTTNDSSTSDTCGTLGVSSGKHYFEVLIGTGTATNYMVGVMKDTYSSEGGTISYQYAGGSVLWYNANGNKYVNNSASSYSGPYTTGDVVGVAFDMDNDTVTFYKNNVSQGVINVTLDSHWRPVFSSAGGAGNKIGVANFGQDSSFAGNKTAQGNSDDNGIGDFYYTPPTGFLALCTQNLPEPTVVPSEHFNTVLYTGNSSTNTITGVGFQPDWSWLKARSVAYSHNIFDVIRGANKQLYSNVTSAEVTDTNSLMSFDNDGFTLNDEIGVNSNGHTYASWNWKANGAGVSNTDGSITSTVSANVDAGFSIVKHTGNKSGAVESVGHGLTKTPELIIQKTMQNGTQGVNGWLVGGTVLGNAGSYLFLNLTNAIANASTYWGNTLPDATNFYVGTSSWVGNDLNIDHINYCFHSVDGYSKVGSYTGNGSTDGTFVYTGFRPAYVMVKRTDSADHWVVLDSDRDIDNPAVRRLEPNLSAAEAVSWEGGATDTDFTSNGFKLRTGYSPHNASGGTYIYLAFAENPFKYTNAR